MPGTHNLLETSRPAERQVSQQKLGESPCPAWSPQQVGGRASLCALAVCTGPRPPTGLTPPRTPPPRLPPGPRHLPLGGAGSHSLCSCGCQGPRADGICSLKRYLSFHSRRASRAIKGHARRQAHKCSAETDAVRTQGPSVAVSRRECTPQRARGPAGPLPIPWEGGWGGGS